MRVRHPKVEPIEISRENREKYKKIMQSLAPMLSSNPVLSDEKREADEDSGDKTADHGIHCHIAMEERGDRSGEGGIQEREGMHSERVSIIQEIDD